MADLAHASAEQLAIIDGLFPKDVASALRDMAISMYLAMIDDEELLETLGLERLANIAVDLTDRVSLDLGGISFYMPKGMASRLSSRNQRILAEFNGRNKHELARKYKISEMRIDQIFKAFRQKNKRDAKDAS